MSLLVPETGLLFWMLLSFGIVFFLLARYGFPVILKMVEDRKTYIDQSLEAAKEANRKLEQVKSESDAILAKAHEEQSRILNEAVVTRDRIVAEAKKLAAAEGLKQLEEARHQIEVEKNEAIRGIRRQVASLSVNIAEKVIRKNLNEENEQMAMIDRLLDECTVSKS